jgi:hypothetical protein
MIEGLRGNRGPWREQRAVEGKEGRRGNIGPERGTEERTEGCRRDKEP